MNGYLLNNLPEAPAMSADGKPHDLSVPKLVNKVTQLNRPMRGIGLLNSQLMSDMS